MEAFDWCEELPDFLVFAGYWPFWKVLEFDPNQVTGWLLYLGLCWWVGGTRRGYVWVGAAVGEIGVTWLRLECLAQIFFSGRLEIPRK